MLVLLIHINIVRLNRIWKINVFVLAASVRQCMSTLFHRTAAARKTQNVDTSINNCLQSASFTSIEFSWISTHFIHKRIAAVDTIWTILMSYDRTIRAIKATQNEFAGRWKDSSISKAKIKWENVKRRNKFELLPMNRSCLLRMSNVNYAFGS